MRLIFRTYARCSRKPYSCVAVIHELPLRRVIFCVSPDTEAFLSASFLTQKFEDELTSSPPSSFAKVGRMSTKTFAQARRQGLKVVAHAGEAEGAQSIWGAINYLQADRIGHSIRCLDDSELVEVLRQRPIPLHKSCSSKRQC